MKLIERFGRFPHRNKVLGRANTRKKKHTSHSHAKGSRRVKENIHGRYRQDKGFSDRWAVCHSGRAATRREYRFYGTGNDEWRVVRFADRQAAGRLAEPAAEAAASGRGVIEAARIFETTQDAIADRSGFCRDARPRR